MTGAGKSAIYVQYTRPAIYPPLERSAVLLARQGWSVLFLGIEVEGAADALQLADHPRIRQELEPRARPGWRRKLHYASFLVACLQRIRAERPTIVYCSDGWSYPIGLLATYLAGSKVVMHEHDTPPLKGTALAWLIAACRRRLARRAQVCVLPQDERAVNFREQTGATRVVVAYNCPQRLDGDGPTGTRSPDGSLILWYHGSLGPGQLPLSVISALALVPATVSLRFAGYETVSNPRFVEELMARAQAAGVRDRVTYLGPLASRASLLAAASEADVGLALFSTVFREPMVGASNKPFDYLACGLPLLVNDTPEWHDFFGRQGVSVSCRPESAEDIARAIVWFLEHPAERREMAERGRRRIAEDWCYEVQFQKVQDAIGASGGPSGHARRDVLGRVQQA